jgi:ectoine hydroxylase-related dioxygenase (phytanoyl-CoA dioxygenase family)
VRSNTRTNEQHSHQQHQQPATHTKLLQKAVAELKKQGFTKLTNLLDGESVVQLRQMRAECESRCNILLEKNGLSMESICTKDKNTYRDVQYRDGRTDLRDKNLTARIVGNDGLGTLLLASICEQYLGGSISAVVAGYLTAMAECQDQRWHVDPFDITTNPTSTNVFIALEDVTEYNGPTELCMMSQEEMAGANNPAAVGQNLRQFVEVCEKNGKTKKVTLNSGEVLIFDTRCLHRGAANTTKKERPMAYAVVLKTQNHDTRVQLDGYITAGKPLEDKD